MVRSCCAVNCKTRFDKNNKHISFHKFPCRPELQKLWILAVRRENWKPTKSNSLCSLHFLPEDFEPFLPGSCYRKLKPTAVPSVFNFPSYLQSPTRENRILEHQYISDEVEEGSPMGGGECSESPAHIMEPQVELNEELEHNFMEPSVELDENIEPHVEIEEGTDQHYPSDTLALEFYEDATDSHANYGETGAEDYHEAGAVVNGLSRDSEDTSVDVAIHDDSQCNSIDTSLDADEIALDTSNSEAMDSSYKEETDNTNYNEMQRTYLEDFFSSSASASVDESSNSSLERIPLSRFPSIVKVVDRAEYETIQILYQLLYQRSAWDTQEILSKRILEFSGFTFNKNSEEHYNREMMLQTLPNSILVKIGAILCLDQVKNVLSNVGLGRHDLINAIMEFLALPRKKTRNRITNSTADKFASEAVEPCGCRNNCLSKFNKVEREFVAKYHTTLREKRKQDAYFLNLIQVNRSIKRPEDDSKKHRDYKYNYKIKLGTKEVGVCKGGFMMLHNVKMSRLNQLQTRLKKSNFPKALLLAAVYPAPEGQEETKNEPSKDPVKNEAESNENSISNSATNSVEDSSASESSSSKPDNVSVKATEEEVKKSLSQKIPAVVVEKIDPNKINSQKTGIVYNDENSSNDVNDSEGEGSAKKKEENVKKKLKDFPLVVKGLDEASEELLIDLHFLLFLTSTDKSKLKKNILDFDGFSFSSDCEEYDERNEFLQRMSGKLITDVARSFSLGVMSKREETIQNILSFLMKPDENYLRTTASVPVILSDVELDDIEGFSDSDESITCEVVEKKVECIDLLSSGEDSDKEESKKTSVVKKEKVEPPKTAPVVPPVVKPTTPVTPASNTTAASSTMRAESSGGVRRLKDFETIRKIVNTHPPEYLVDIYELLFLKKHEANREHVMDIMPNTLRSEILDFTGFKFEKGSQEYVKRKQVLDRMLYNNVRRVYNTLIHNSTEVKVFSKPTMINEIFQFLFKLPDHDTSVRPLPPGAKTLMPKQPASVTVTKLKSSPIPSAPPATTPASILPSQTGKLSDLKRVFQRVACFPCEYLVDVHKLLFMSDCDPKVIRQNIFGFKGFSFSVDSSEFQQRKMYLEYLTFHSLRKISSVLTTRSVDLRNSTKHELASHLTDVLAEYCNNNVDADKTGKENKSATTPVSTAESILVSSIIEGIQSVSSSASSTTANSKSEKSPSNTLNISIVETRSISSPAVSTSSPSLGRGSRKRKNQTVRQMVTEKKKSAPTPAQPPESSQFADIHLPEVEQYRQIYGANLSVYPNVPTITGIASFGSAVPQTFPQLVPQAMTFPLVSPYPQNMQFSGIQQPPQMLSQQSTALTMTSPIITQVSTKPPEVIVPADIEHSSLDPQNKSQGIPAIEKSDSVSKESPNKNNSQNKDSEEDGDQPLASLIGHPTDNVLKKQISDIVEKTDLQDITMNGVIQRIYDMYPKFDLSYRKEFIKSALRTILYKLGENSEKTEATRDSNSPDCSVTTTDINDSSLPNSPLSNA